MELRETFADANGSIISRNTTPRDPNGSIISRNTTRAGLMYSDDAASRTLNNFVFGDLCRKKCSCHNMLQDKKADL